MNRTDRRPALAVVVAVLVALGCLVAGCGGQTYAEQQRDRIEAATPRTDLEPILKRWPQLGGMQQAHWVGGVLTDERTPGPNSYFVEAAVVLSPADITRLTSQYHFGPGARPDPPASLRPFVRDGAWLRNQEADQAFSSEMASSIYVQPESSTVYVSAKGN